MKPLSHLRPLLRLPSHPTPQPNLEHFTSNPSLLHHLPNHAGSSHSLVGSSSSAASAAGSGGASNAGRAGWGGAGAGGSGGYTGHARAFFSIPQTSGADASSSLIGTSDENKKARRHSRSELALRHRLEQDRGRHTRLVDLPDSAGGRSEVQREIASRSGGATFAIVDVEGESPSRSRSPRRSSIAFPSPVRALPSLPGSPTPSGGRPPPRRRGLNRSSSRTDVWQVGIPHRTPISARTISTSSTPLPANPTPEVSRASTPIIPLSHPSPSSHRIAQPNHVLMDLAGLDLPPRKALGRRYNSSLASHSRTVDDSVLASLPSSSSSSAATDRSKDIDLKIFHALQSAKEWRQRDTILALVAHYRSPRSVSPFASSQVAGDPALATKYPLPEGWTVATYNACLECLLSVRAPGESISLILEIYNEMLERDLVPNARTYANVMRALCFREADVRAAGRRWEEEKTWGRWRHRHLGARWDRALEKEKEALVEGYESEENLASALKLFRAATMLQPAAWHFPSYNYALLLETLAKSPNPDLGAVNEVFEHAKFRDVNAWRGLYRHVLRAYSRAGDKEGLEATWKEFEDMRTSGQGAGEVNGWFESEVASQPGAPIAGRIQGLVREVYQSAIEGLIRVGEVDTALGIFNSMLERPLPGEAPAPAGALDIPPVAGSTFGIVLSSLAEVNLPAATKFYDEHAESAKLNATRHQRFPIADMYIYIDALILAGDSIRAAEVYAPESWKKKGMAGFMPDKDRVKRVYAALLAAASSPSTSADDVGGILPKITALNAGYNAALPLDYALVRVHWDILAKHGRYDDMPAVLDNFTPRHKEAIDFARIPQTVIPHMSLKAAVTFVGNLQRHHQNISSAVAERVAEVYSSTRASRPTAGELNLTGQEWAVLVRCFARLSEDFYADGGKDELLETVMGDLKTISGNQSFQKQLEFIEFDIVDLRAILTDRFGRDRTAELTSMFPSATSSDLSSSSDAAPSSSDMSTPISSTAPETSSPAPSSMSSPTSELAQPPAATPAATPQSPALIIDPRLSELVDSHWGRSPRVSPVQAYEAIRSSLHSSGAVAHPGSIARLIVSLARLGEEGKVVELYNLSQTLLSGGSVPENHQVGAWKAIENSMIQASCLLGHLEQAGMHRSRLIGAGGVPTADAYATMIASSKDTTDDALVARELFDESQQLGVVPHLYLYNTIISKLSKARKAELALELFGHMKRANVRPSSVTYGAVINACCRVGDAESAETLFAEMSAMQNFKPRVPPFNTMMQFYLQTIPSREKVLHYFTLLRQSGVAPSAHTYKLLLDAYSVIAPLDLNAMERVFAELVNDRSVEVSGTHWASVITAHGLIGGDVTRALEIFDAIPAHPTTKSGGIEPVVWESMLHVLASKGTLEELDNVRTRMIDSGVRPTAYVYNVLITGYGRHHRMDLARELFEGMGDSVSGVAAPNNHPALRTSAGHLKPNTTTVEDTGVVYREPSTYESMIRAEMLYGERRRAEEVVGRMEARGYPVAVFLRARAMLDDQNVGAVTPNMFGDAAAEHTLEEKEEK